MKKLLCFALCVMMVLSFAACGESDKGSATDNGSKAADNANTATSIKFDAASYTVNVEGILNLKDHITIEPATAEVTYSVSDESVILVDKKGEVYGNAEGTATVTATSGSVTAKCEITSVGVGTIVARDDVNKIGGITKKYYKAVEDPDDSDAYIIIVSKNIKEGTDMTNAADFVYGESDDGLFGTAYDGYYVAKTNDRGQYKFENVPVGEYVGLIISSSNYPITYDFNTTKEGIASSAIGKYFNDAELTKIAAKSDKHEYFVDEFTVKTGELTVFGHRFRID